MSVVATVAIAGGGGVMSGAIAGADGVPGNTIAGWQAVIARLSLPRAGCFKASYPLREWRATECQVAPHVPLDPAMGKPSETAADQTPNSVGRSNDYSAVVAGNIFQATGSFTNVSPNISETGQIAGVGPQLANTFTIQLNTQYFVTPKCSGASNAASCRGWQQFVYNTESNAVYMQYWLLNYGTSCPSNWMPGPGNDCYKNSQAKSLSGGGVTASELASVRLTGTAVPQSAEPGFDGVALSDGSRAIAVSESDNTLDLAQHWDTSQFDAYGDGNYGQANFGANTTLETQTTLLSTSTLAPTCVKEGFTGETNNLDLTSTPAIGIAGLPTIASKQTNHDASSASCATEAETPENFEITSVSPASISDKGGEVLTINGSGFLDVFSLFNSATVWVGDSPISVLLTVESDKRATIIAPAEPRYSGPASVELSGCVLGEFVDPICQDLEGSFRYTRT